LRPSGATGVCGFNGKINQVTVRYALNKR
jgi:hypothetical protein